MYLYKATDLCALSVLCVRKKSHAESAEIAEEFGLVGGSQPLVANNVFDEVVKG